MVSQSTIQSLQKLESDTDRSEGQSNRPALDVIYVAPAKDNASHNDAVEIFAESPQQLFDILDDFDGDTADEVIAYEYAFVRTVKLKRNFEIAVV